MWIYNLQISGIMGYLLMWNGALFIFQVNFLEFNYQLIKNFTNKHDFWVCLSICRCPPYFVDNQPNGCSWIIWHLLNCTSLVPVFPTGASNVMKTLVLYFIARGSFVSSRCFGGREFLRLMSDWWTPLLLLSPGSACCASTVRTVP